jgi:uncharacterized protein (TIGR02231 family)
MNINVDAEITSVTVFPDRALVTMQGEFKAASGNHEIQIDGLPTLMDMDSVRVKGHGEFPFKIASVDIRTEYYEDYPEEKVAELVALIEQADEEISALEDETDIQASQSNYLDGLREASGQFARGLSRGKTQVEDQATLIQFLLDQDRSIKSAMRDLKNQKKKIEDRRSKLQRDLAKLEPARQKKRRSAVIGIEAAGEGAARIELSYTIIGASWKPLYDIRLTGESGAEELSITAIAEISQKTGQDWSDVELSISTARPAIAERAPELKPHYLDVYRSPVAPDLRVRGAPTAGLAMPMSEMSEEPQYLGSLESFHDAEPVTAQLEADRGLSFTFRIPGNADIPSDGSPHKRTLTTFDLEPELDYLAIPKHTDAVFRRIKVENSPDTPLLPGKVNLFAGDEFIGSTEIEYIPTGGELELLFGVEERITVTRELKRRDVDKVLLRDRRQLRFGYEIEIENLMPVPVQIELQDQYPVSRHENIKVHLEKSEPKPSEVSELNIMEWSISLEVSQKKSIIIAYGVDHPRGMEIVGLSRD